MVWLPDGQTLAAIHQTGIYLYDAATLAERRFFPAYGSKMGLAASPDSRYLVINAADGVQFWDIATGQMVHAVAEQPGPVDLIAFGPGGTTLVTSGSKVEDEGWQDWVALWDLAGMDNTGTVSSQLRYQWDGFTKGVSSVAMSPDGMTLVTASAPDWDDPNDTALRFWDVATGGSRPVEGDLRVAPSYLKILAFSPDGHLLAGIAFSEIDIWDVTTGSTLHVLHSPGFNFQTLAFSPDGRFLAAGTGDGVVIVWGVEDGQEVMTITGHTDEVVRVAFGPVPAPGTGELLLATATARDGIQVWNALNGQRLGIIPQVGHTDYTPAVAYSPDGRLLASADVDETIWLWDVSTMLSAGTANGPPPARLASPRAPDGSSCACYWSLAFSPDGHTLAAGSTDSYVRLWDVSHAFEAAGAGIEGERVLDMSDAPAGLVGSVTFNPDGQLLVAGDLGGNVWLWDLAAPLSAGPLLRLDNPPTALSTSFSPDGRTLATGSGFGVIRLWDVSSGTLLREMQGSSNSVRATFSPDGSILASGSSGFQPDYAVRLWDPASGAIQRTMEGHTTDIKGLAFSPDSRLLAASDADGFTRLWDTRTGQQLQTLEQPWSAYSVAFSPDGQQLATGGWDGLIRIWGIP
jgi:WD40 repeat protein